jgi:hypothetical protein
MGVLRAVVERPMLTVLDARKHLALRGAIAWEFIGADDSWDVGEACEQLPAALLRSLLVPTTVDEHIEDVAVLIDGTPQGMPFTIARQHHLSQRPFVTRTGTPAPALIGRRLANFPAPLADRFVRSEDPTDAQECFHVAVAQAEAVVQPHAMAADLSRKPLVFVALRRGWRGHAVLP